MIKVHEVKFQYLQFASRDEFRTRLLHVSSDEDGHGITCQTVHVETLEAPQELSYTALSYVWGERTDLKRIRVRDDASSGELEVGSNLFQFMKEVIRKRETVLFWIDAICVDQEMSMSETIKSDGCTKFTRMQREQLSGSTVRTTPSCFMYSIST